MHVHNFDCTATDSWQGQGKVYNIAYIRIRERKRQREREKETEREREREREGGKGERKTYSWAGSLLGEDGVRGDERPSMSSGELTRSFRSCSYKKINAKNLISLSIHPSLSHTLKFSVVADLLLDISCMLFQVILQPSQSVQEHATTVYVVTVTMHAYSVVIIL